MAKIVIFDDFGHFWRILKEKLGFCAPKPRKTLENVAMTSLRVSNIIIHHLEGSEGV